LSPDFKTEYKSFNNTEVTNLTLYRSYDNFNNNKDSVYQDLHDTYGNDNLTKNSSNQLDDNISLKQTLHDINKNNDLNLNESFKDIPELKTCLEESLKVTKADEIKMQNQSLNKSEFYNKNFNVNGISNTNKKIVSLTEEDSVLFKNMLNTSTKKEDINTIPITSNTNRKLNLNDTDDHHK